MSFATWYNSHAQEGWAYNDPSQGLWQIDLAVLARSLGRADRQRHERQSKEAALIRDGEPSHNSFIDALALKSRVHTSAETKGLKDGENPMDPINDVHDKMEKFMRAHPGYDRSRLQDWMNLFWFIWCTPGDKMDKAKAFLRLAISKRIRIKYRDVFGKKPDGD